jgi:hypothetical protein
LALAGFYAPALDDIVLAIGQEDDYYVIGVIRTHGKVTLTFPADLEIQAPRGRIDVLSGREIRFRSPRMSLSAVDLEVLARTIRESFTSAYRRVRDLFKIRAGQMSTDVDESCHLYAERIVEKAQKEVLIDGESINLG